jgi:hypothetical protein
VDENLVSKYIRGISNSTNFEVLIVLSFLAGHVGGVEAESWLRVFLDGGSGRSTEYTWDPVAGALLGGEGGSGIGCTLGD